EVRIVLRDLGLIVGAAAAHHRFSAQRQTFIYPRIGAFIITADDEIAVEVAPGASANLVALPLLGPVMGVLLHLRGRFVLHGSAVEFGSAGYGFVGDKGAGKSTLAAALVGSGAALLSDDLLAFDDKGSILPAFPQLKLSSEALAMSGRVDARVMPSPAEGFPKH